MADELGYEEMPPGSHIWLVRSVLEFYVPGWYFSDETEQFNGPFGTREEAERNLGEYCKWLDQPPVAFAGNNKEEPNGVEQPLLHRDSSADSTGA